MPDNQAGAQSHFAGFIDTIVETTGIGLWDWNLQTDHVVYSPQWEIIAGHAPGSLPQDVSSWAQAVLPEDLPYAEAQIERCLTGEAPLYEAEFRMLRPDGTIFWAQDKGTVAAWDDNGRPLRLVGILQDVTRIKRTEAALKREKDQIAFISAMAGLGRWDWNVPREHIQYDDNYLRMLGYAPQDVDGSYAQWEAFIHPDDRPRVIAALDDYLQGRADHYAQETRMRHKDGHYLWTLDIGRIVEWTPNGAPLRVLGGHLDIDRLKTTELRLTAALEENERINAQLKRDMDRTVRDLTETLSFSDAMSDANPYINILFDDQLQLTDCNPAAVAYFGFDKKADLLENLLPLINKSIPAFQPDGSPSTPLSTRFAYVIEHGFIEFEVELVLSGRRVPMRFTLKKIAHRDTFAIAGYLLDMQQLKEARNELLRQDYLLRQVNQAATRMMSAEPERFDQTISRVLKNLGRSVKASRMSIWENIELDGRPACRGLYLWDGEVRGDVQTPYPEGLPYAQIPDWYDDLRARKTINIKTRDLLGDERAFLLSKNARVLMLIPVFQQEEFWGFIGLDKSSEDDLFTPVEARVIQSGGILIVSAILRNQASQRMIAAREAALQSDKAKSEFLSRMSHEIRTPMNAIIGMTGIAMKTDDLGRIRYSLERIETASGQLLDIINDILDMAKIESGKFDITPAPFDLEATMQSVFDMVQVRVDEKGQNFSFDFESLFERYVVLDELRLTQVLINLLTNASKFTPEGGEISLHVGWRHGTGDEDMLRVSVRDSGIGISQAQQARLFRSFEQADGSITRRFGGTGLGLAISQSIIRLMGGDIRVESEEGRGSCFSFEIPFTWGAPLAERAQVRKVSGLYLLVVDDSEETRQSLCGMLSRHGMEVDLAASGEEAVAMARAALDAGRPYDAALIDWYMPGMDGSEAARAIRALERDGLPATMVVMMSAGDRADLRARLKDVTVASFLPKPVLPSMLFDALAPLTGARIRAQKAREAARSITPAHRFTGRRVLVVEDVAINREILTALLEDTGLALDFAENGRLAVEAMARTPEKWDLVLMDVQMPEMDGLEATRRIRAMDSPAAKTVPIIAMTANAFSQDVEACLAAGMNDHIAKPIDVDAMLEKLAVYLGYRV